MKVVYGGLTLQDCASVQISRTTRRDGTGRRIGYTERWTIQGWVTGADAAAITTAVNTVKAAFAVDGQNLSLLTNASAATSHAMVNASTLGGVRVVEEPSFPEGAGPEYANVRHFQVVVEADFQDAGLSSIASFQESVVTVGTGGERFVTLVPLDGLPIQQTVAKFTPVTITQSGSAVGLAGYPTPAPPLLAVDEKLDQRQITYKGPERLANGAYQNYSVDWQYVFELAMPATVGPHVWGI